MPLVQRVLPDRTVDHIDDHLAIGGGRGLAATLEMTPTELISVVTESGLRGRGGAGFSTGAKWTTVAANASSADPTTVVVNAAEGEPSTFKDRSIIRRNPFAVLEGALIAAAAVGATRVIIGLKSTFVHERTRLEAAIAELPAEWTASVGVELLAGPAAYLLGEETALLEAINGRPPFPRLAPPFRRGVDDVTASPDDDQRRSAARVELATPAQEASSPPALVDNVETLANVGAIVANGAEWFREVGTFESPGTIVCTVTGRAARPGVFEVAMGTPLSEVLEMAGAPHPRHRTVAVLPGVSNPVITPERFDTPLTYEAMAAAGSGLGSGSFAVFDETSDMAAVTAGASRFLFVESCGQCTPCKQDGRVISGQLDSLIAHDGSVTDLDTLAARLDTVADGARCALARQHEAVVRSLVDSFGDAFAAHLADRAEPVERVLVSEVVELADGEVTLDEGFVARQPDWSTDAIDSGQAPVDRATEVAAQETNDLERIT